MKTLLPYIVLFILLLNSMRDGRRLGDNDIQHSKDSISILINLSKEKRFSIEERTYYLDKAYAKAKDVTIDSLRNDYLLGISFEYYKLQHYQNFRKVNLESTILSYKLKDSNSIAANYWDLGIVYSKLGSKDSAYYSYFKAQKLYELIGNDYYSGRMLLNMAIIQSKIKDYTGSEITTIKAISLLKPLSENKHLYRCYNNLGICFNNLEEYDKAIENHKIALTYLKKINDDNTFEENTLNNLGVVYKNKNEYAKAIEYYQRALKNEDLKKTNIKLHAMLLDNIAYSKLKLKDTVGVKALLYNALKIRDSIHDNLGITVNTLHLAEYYLYAHDTVKAKEYALKTKRLATSIKNFRELLPSLLLLSTLDPKNSQLYTNNYIRLNDSLIKEERSIRNKFTRIRFETDEVIDENVRLSKQKQFLFIVLGLLSIFGFLLYMIRNEKIKNRTLRFEQLQQQANEEIYNLMLTQQGKLEEGRKKEKKRISEELHDGVLGKLFGTRLILGTLNTKNDKTAIAERERLINDLQEIEEEVRNVSHELNNESKLSNITYWHLINDLLENQSKVGRFTYVATYDDAINWEEIKGGLKMNLYRIIQEALQNINKYANAHKVQVEFKRQHEHLVLSIQDDGIGFNTEAKRKGIGLLNMQSRVRKFNGKLTLSSIKDKGTLILIEIPIDR